MPIRHHRREFLSTTCAAAAGLSLSGFAGPGNAADSTQGGKSEKDGKAGGPLYKISLGEYSLHRMLGQKNLDHLDFAQHSKDVHGIDAVEYWSGPFQGKVADKKYIAELKKRAADHGVTSLLILVHGEGQLGPPDGKQRIKAGENPYQWVEPAATARRDSAGRRTNSRAAGDPTVWVSTRFGRVWLWGARKR